MREALIVWGGWSGHEPEKGAHIVSAMLEEEGFKVYIENTTEAFADPTIADMSLIVPIYTMSKIEKEELQNLTRAVENGVGLGGYHGGMCDAFRNATFYDVSPVLEATTLGAAYLAGMAVGTWADEAEVASAWAPRAVVAPTGTLDRDRWKEAVSRAQGWIPELSSLQF